MKDFICRLCPRSCGAMRARTGVGFCGMGAMPRIARAAPHFDEEPVLSGTRGSGAIFFSGCSLKCLFCQNYELSHADFGEEITLERLCEIYAELEGQGVHNINLVNPTHWARAILESLKKAPPRVPVVWNSSGYERCDTLRELEGRVQIYLPDLKYVSPDHAQRYSGARDYFEYAAPAIKEMLRQTGSAELDENGIMRRGTIVRHLILPGCAKDSKRVLDFIARELPGAWVSLMAQYLPYGAASGVDELGRALYPEEYEEVVEYMLDLGLEDGFVQELSASDENYIPRFDLTGVARRRVEA